MKPQEMFKKLQSSYQCSFKFKILKMCKKTHYPYLHFPVTNIYHLGILLLLKNAVILGQKKKSPL